MEGRRAAEGRAACSRRGREAPPALAGRGLRLTARALGAVRLRAGGGGARRDAACGCGVRRSGGSQSVRGAAHQKRRESMGKIVGLLIARPGRGGKKGGRKDAGAAQTKAGAGGK